MPLSTYHTGRPAVCPLIEMDSAPAIYEKYLADIVLPSLEKHSLGLWHDDVRYPFHADERDGSSTNNLQDIPSPPSHLSPASAAYPPFSASSLSPALTSCSTITSASIDTPVLVSKPFFVDDKGLSAGHAPVSLSPVPPFFPYASDPPQICPRVSPPADSLDSPMDWYGSPPGLFVSSIPIDTNLSQPDCYQLSSLDPAYQLFSPRPDQSFSSVSYQSFSSFPPDVEMSPPEAMALQPESGSSIGPFSLEKSVYGLTSMGDHNMDWEPYVPREGESHDCTMSGFPSDVAFDNPNSEVFNLVRRLVQDVVDQNISRHTLNSSGGYFDRLSVIKDDHELGMYDADDAGPRTPKTHQATQNRPQLSRERKRKRCIAKNIFLKKPSREQQREKTPPLCAANTRRFKGRARNASVVDRMQYLRSINAM
ncbi:hypothetical protein PLICRDRAFT_701044 [Plicaturopsis crispa FD-325 SS-3]|nr:hypothetical protein PLICRDRAFT_701044 [Plicaturopsis crispa FD-325 SS-3]